MKTFRQLRVIGWSLWILIGIVSQAFGQTSMTMSLRYDTFIDDKSPESTGYEITVPIGIAYKQEHFSLSLETAYASAHADWSDGSEASLSSLTDILVSGSYSYTFPGRPVVLLFGLDVNLPTGKAALNETERWAEAGESNDLFEVDDFGTGLNIAPSIGVLKEFNRINAVLNGAYIVNGEYNPTSEIPDDNLDPGDQAFLLGGLEWDVSDRVDLGTFLSYSFFTPDKTNGKESFREGQRLVIGGSVRLNYDPTGIVLSLQYAGQGKSETLVDETLQEEPDNSSNGNELFGVLAVTYASSQRLFLRGQADIRYYGESDFKDDATGLPFSGKRVRYAIGSGFQYQLRSSLAWNGLLKLFTMDQDADMFTDEDVTFWGTNFDIGLTYVF